MEAFSANKKGADFLGLNQSGGVTTYWIFKVKSHRQFEKNPSELNCYLVLLLKNFMINPGISLEKMNK